MSIKGVTQTMYVRKEEASIITLLGNTKIVVYNNLKHIDYMYAIKSESGYIDFVDNNNRTTRFEFNTKANDLILKTINLIHKKRPELTMNEKHAGDLRFYERWWFMIVTMFFCCGPIGLFLMWYKKKSTLDFRILLTIIIIAIWGSGTYAVYLTMNNTNAALDAYHDTLNGANIKEQDIPLQSESLNKTESNDIYKASTYKIGNDMPAGEYVLIADDTDIKYFQISNDSTGLSNSIITNGVFQTNSIVTVDNGQYFNFTGCYAVPISEDTTLDTTKEGMFKVGKHLDPGEYQLWASNESDVAYYAIHKDSSHNSESIKTNGIIEGRTYVTVEKGEYLELTGCYIME
ncbi:hypothetical protein [Lacrimispora sp.]|uniref:hypothetical protein n=1 Tax=Lacrimispora sp. TaxID=2719234 RepID=UPI0028AF512C|nr:hypothetical protein [Lacrimispora sp.]